MQGSLDGLTGSNATSNRFFQHVPEMRAQYGALYPASYYRLKEAYDLKSQIDAEDARRKSYFAQFDARLVDQTSLNREIDSGEEVQTVGVNPEERKLTDEEKAEASEKRGAEAAEAGKANVKSRSKAVEDKRRLIETTMIDQEKRAQATSSFASWQRKMENIQQKSGKRNIVNNYVWDADGGLRVESQSFADSAEHMIGGSFSLNAGFGVEGKFMGSGVAVELTAQATVNMTQTMTKTEARSKGLELNVDLSGVESIGITNHNDYPLQPGEKVDRYRFMSFYLEASTKNFNDFFAYVVDPEWLASNDEEARALRQAKGKANATWRVLHRVTYVERPALMGFGRDTRRPWWYASVGTVQSVVDELQRQNEELKKQNESLLDKVQSILKNLNASNRKEPQADNH